MKSYILGISMLVAVLMLSSLVAGASVTIQQSTIQMGSKTTSAAIPEDDNGDPRAADVSAVITFTQDFSTTLTDIQCEFLLDSEDSDIKGTGDVSDVVEGYQSYLDLDCKNLATTLSPNNNAQASVSGRIPAGLDAVDANGREKAFRVAQVRIKGKINNSQVFSNFVTINMERENNLAIDDVQVTADGDEQSVNDGDNVKDIKPGAKIETEITGKNQYSSSEDVDIEDITISLVIDDSDLDVDEDDDLGDLGAKDDDSVTLTFDVDEDAPDGTYKAEILALGRDEYGAVMGEFWSVDFEVTRKTHEVSINSFALTPQTLTCGRNTVTASLKAINIGKRDEDAIVIEMDAPELDFNQKVENIQLDKDDSTSRSFTIDVPANTPAGTYTVTAKTYFDNTFISNLEELTLTVPDCSAPRATPAPTPRQTPTATEPLVIVQPPVTQPPVVQPPVVQPTVEPTEPEVYVEEQSNIGLYIGILAVLIVVLLIVGIFMVAYLLREPKH